MTDETKTPEQQPSEPSKPAWWDEEPAWVAGLRETLNPDPEKEEERRQRNLAIHKQQLDAKHGIVNADNPPDDDGDPFEIVSVEELPELIEDVADKVTEPVKAAADAAAKIPEKVHALFRKW